MYVIIPLGGLGERFKKHGYTNPKPFVYVLGKRIIEWLVDNLKTERIDAIFIPYHRDLSKFHFEEEMRMRYPDILFYFMELRENTEGASDSIYRILDFYEKEGILIEEKPILSVDGDNFYLTDIISLWKGENNVFVFEDMSQEPIYSYVCEKEGKIERIVEKERVSQWASTGAYGFSSWIELKKYCKKVMEENRRQKNEFYISTVIQRMIEDGIEYQMKKIEIENYICLGTPIHVRIFCNNYPKINALNGKEMISKKIYCFEFEQTLFYSSPDYIPNEKNIQFLKYLKKMGHKIVLKTGHVGGMERMRILNKLDEYDIHYHAIYFGNIEYDFYIGNRVVSVNQDMEKETGFYNMNIEPRDFHQIENSGVMPMIKKSGKDLRGEIYYYKNIPHEIKDIFPFYIRGDDVEGKWYEMEKVVGIPFSKLYIMEEMTEMHLGSILGTLHRIHSCKVENGKEIDIYENYEKKMIERYQSFDYSSYPFCNLYIEKIKEKLIEYKEKGLGKRMRIHGDPVLTNVMLNGYGKIKMIDMRGKIGDVYTEEGDVMYDYAKVAQSILGYDEILGEREMRKEYKERMYGVIEREIRERYGEEYLGYMRWLVGSLIVSLIPLHNNEKCVEYDRLLGEILKDR
jgi:UDP-N-acetylglucosamine diphosphorylase / glucose-1-phosphate thymidylyltransferase / UDP-N-acetylgalactosamine diphosphorylase / glucosamine-1-phosphate N-acetyltransferase / galactosamine-1-phosphate N-acetyltransferase